MEAEEEGGGGEKKKNKMYRTGRFGKLKLVPLSDRQVEEEEEGGSGCGRAGTGTNRGSRGSLCATKKNSR